MDNTISIGVSYDKNGNSSAFAYLDYIEMQAKCELKYNGGQLVFSEPSTVGIGNVTKFNVTSNKTPLLYGMLQTRLLFLSWKLTKI